MTWFDDYRESVIEELSSRGLLHPIWVPPAILPYNPFKAEIPEEESPFDFHPGEI